MTTSDDISTTGAGSAPNRLPTSTLLIAGGAVLILIGSFLPWVKIFAFGISGVDTDYGIITLLIGVIALVAAFGAGRVFDAGKTRAALVVTAVLGAVALACALYVGFAIRDSVAEDEGGTDTAATEEESGLGEEFDDALEDFASALEPQTGVGVYTTALGGVLVLAGGLMGAARANQ